VPGDSCLAIATSAARPLPSRWHPRSPPARSRRHRPSRRSRHLRCTRSRHGQRAGRAQALRQEERIDQEGRRGGECEGDPARDLQRADARGDAVAAQRPAARRARLDRRGVVHAAVLLLRSVEPGRKLRPRRVLRHRAQGDRPPRRQRPPQGRRHAIEPGLPRPALRHLQPRDGVRHDLTPQTPECGRRSPQPEVSRSAAGRLMRPLAEAGVDAAGTTNQPLPRDSRPPRGRAGYRCNQRPRSTDRSPSTP
jgi:hypothetical protein